MLYAIVKFCTGFLLNIFFRDIRVRGEKLIEHGPLIIVANHPNFMFDPVLLGKTYSRQLSFVAKSTLFSNFLLAFLLKALRVVPIYRRQDEDYNAGSNDKSFKAVGEKLKKNEAIVIFPEGVSMGERRIFAIKTGTARIALQSVLEGKASSKLLIQPVGISYSDLKDFRSTVTLRVGSAIAPEEFLLDCESNGSHAVHALTAKIEESIRELTVELPEQELSETADIVLKLYSSFGYNVDDFELLHSIAHHLKQFSNSNPEAYNNLKLKFEWYESLADALCLDAAEPPQNFKVIILLLLAIFVLFGSLVFFLPYRLTGVLANLAANDGVETASFKLIFGLVLFLLWYIALIVVLLLLEQSLATSLSVLVFLTGCGYISMKYINIVRARLLLLLFPGSSRALKRYRDIRNELFQRCEELRSQ